MMKKIVNKICLALTTILVLAFCQRCRSPYIPPASSTSVNYLHVEGFINTGDVTLITLSRTVKLTDTASSKPELGASVSIVSNDSRIYRLNELGNGIYSTLNVGLPVTSTEQYGLRIITADGKIYQSDLVPVKNSPPVDSLTFTGSSTGIEVYSNTHDPANATRYYRWDYVETWENESAYDSFWEGETTPVDTVIPRPPQDQIYRCWQSQNSSTIILNSSAKLSQDVIAQNPLAHIATLSPKFAIEYSILVSQYALTSDAFNYWQNLKTNTEQLGSIFDAQPSEIQGNIHCVSNPSEPVLGYVSAGAVSQKRLFIGGSSMPRPLGEQIPSLYGNCVLDTLYYKNPVTHQNDVQNLYFGNPIPVNGLLDIFSGKYIGYSASSKSCVDCRVYGGTNIKPGYWIDKF